MNKPPEKSTGPTSPTPAAAVAPPVAPVVAPSRRTLRTLIEGPEFRAAVAKALPKHLSPDRFLRIAITTITRTPKLLECDKASVFNCLLTLSQLGLEPDGRRAHLIPFGNRRRGTLECQLIIDYKGLVELIMRNPAIANVHSDIVCENDVFVYNLGIIEKHIIDFRKPRGEPYAAYTIFRFRDGPPKCEVMSRDEIEAVRRCSNNPDAGPWKTHWAEMAKKTTLRRGAKTIPFPAEIFDALEAEDTAAQVVDVHSALAQIRDSQSSIEQVFGDAADTPKATSEKDEEVPEEISEEAPTAPQPPPTASTVQSGSLQAQVESLILGAGCTYNDLQHVAVEQGFRPNLASVPSFADLSDADASWLLKNKTGILRSLQLYKGGA